MALQGRRDGTDRGSVLIPILIATLLGALLAVGGAIALVRAQATANVAPVTKPLISYDQR